jgi:hypothetical protein
MRLLLVRVEEVAVGRYDYRLKACDVMINGYLGIAIQVLDRRTRCILEKTWFSAAVYCSAGLLFDLTTFNFPSNRLTYLHQNIRKKGRYEPFEGRRSYSIEAASYQGTGTTLEVTQRKEQVTPSQARVTLSHVRVTRKKARVTSVREKAQHNHTRQHGRPKFKEKHWQRRRRTYST